MRCGAHVAGQAPTASHGHARRRRATDRADVTRRQDPARSLPHRVARRRGRHGQGVRGAARRARSPVRREGAASAVRSRPAGRAPLPARGPRDVAHPASERRRGQRLRGDPRQRRVPGDGAARGRDARRSAHARAQAAVGARASDRAAAVRGAAGRPRRRRRASRRDARELLRRGRRRRRDGESCSTSASPACRRPAVRSGRCAG